MRRKYGVTKLKCLGGFRNNRKVYEWRGHTLELDETLFEWGTCYELELETVSPAPRYAVWGVFGFCRAHCLGAPCVGVCDRCIT